MRYLLIPVTLLIPALSFALFCPSNGVSLDEGLNIQKVKQLCGAPKSSHEYMVKTGQMEEWTYFKSIENHPHTRITLVFQDKKVTEINVFHGKNDPEKEQNLASTEICGGLIQSGNDNASVRTACGNPAFVRVLQGYNTKFSELNYVGPGPNILVFQDGKLVDWK